jgi:hypothetical protein
MLERIKSGRFGLFVDKPENATQDIAGFGYSFKIGMPVFGVERPLHHPSPHFHPAGAEEGELGTGHLRSET